MRVGYQPVLFIGRQSESSEKSLKAAVQVRFSGDSGLTRSESQVLAELHARKPMQAEQIVLVTDPNRDPDDLAAFIISGHLQKQGFISVKAATTALGDATVREQRARFTKEVFTRLGLNKVAVASGGDYPYANEKRAKDDQTFFKTELLSAPEALASAKDGSRLSGVELLRQQLATAPDKSINLVLIAGMRDPASLLSDSNPNKEADRALFQQKVKSVTIMGGVEDTPGADGLILPDTRAFNNTCDQDAANTVYRETQILGVPLTVLNKEATYAAAVNPQFYEGFAATGNPVGQYLKGIQKTALGGLWQSIQKGVIPTLTPDWFFKFFTELDPERDQAQIEQLKDQPFDQIWPRVSKLNLYDPLTLLAATPGAKDMLYRPKLVSGKSQSPVYVIGAQEVAGKEKAGILMSALGKMSLSS